MIIRSAIYENNPVSLHRAESYLIESALHVSHFHRVNAFRNRHSFEACRADKRLATAGISAEVSFVLSF